MSSIRMSGILERHTDSWSAILLSALTCVSGIILLASPVAAAGQQKQSHPPVQAEDENEIAIESASELPDTYPYANYQFFLRAHGGVGPLRWSVERAPDKGPLPPGIKLDDNGRLYGEPQRAGEFRFTLRVRDGNQNAVHKEFTLRVLSALSLNWKTEAHVSGSRIEGSAEVSNTTRDDIDLTYIVLAVPPNGRAVAIGYQHFLLKRGTINMELPFGETLPRGSYVVHVDAIGEVASRNVIHRERLQSPSPLQVATGP